MNQLPSKKSSTGKTILKVLLVLMFWPFVGVWYIWAKLKIWTIGKILLTIPLAFVIFIIMVVSFMPNESDKTVNNRDNIAKIDNTEKQKEVEAEKKKLTEEQKRLEEAKKAEEQRKAEEKKAEEEKQRAEEEKKKLEEAKKAEEAKKVEEQRKLEETKKAEEKKKKEEEAKKAEEAKTKLGVSVHDFTMNLSNMWGWHKKEDAYSESKGWEMFTAKTKSGSVELEMKGNKENLSMVGIIMSFTDNSTGNQEILPTTEAILNTFLTEDEKTKVIKEMSKFSSEFDNMQDGINYKSMLRNFTVEDKRYEMIFDSLPSANTRTIIMDILRKDS